MNVNSIIVEQLEWSGLLKSVTMDRQNELGELWISFPDEYLDERNSPFHFLDKKYQNHFQNQQQNGRVVNLGKKRFFENNKIYHFNTLWNGIRTQRNELTFYSLYLPEFAVPTEIKICDSFPPNNEFKKSVYKDIDKNRFVIYLECRSKIGIFNFKMNTIFYENKDDFEKLEFNDETTIEFYYPHSYENFLPEETSKQVITYLNQTIMNGDTYNVNQAGAVGPNSSSNNNTFNQQNLNIPENLNFEKLSEELIELKKVLLENASTSEHYQAIADIANAEKASEEKDGNKVAKYLMSGGKWVLDFGTKVGVSIVTELIKSQMKP
jgi:hypothetical protein